MEFGPPAESGRTNDAMNRLLFVYHKVHVQVLACSSLMFRYGLKRSSRGTHCQHGECSKLLAPAYAGSSGTS